MKFPNPITESDIPSLHSLIQDKDIKIQKQVRISEIVAVVGHISFFTVLSCMAFFLACRNILQKYPYAPKWIRQTSNILHPLITKDTPDILSYILLVLLLLIIPFLLCMIARLLCSFLSFPTDILTEKHTDTEETVKYFIAKLDEFELSSESHKWDYHFPFMNGLESLLPFPCVILPYLLIALTVSKKLHNTALIPEALINSLFIALPVIFIWKLSAIFNSAAYYYSDENYDGLRDELNGFLNAYLGKEKDNRSILEKKLAADYFAKAMSNTKLDYELMKKAAELNHPEACLLYGKYLLSKQREEILTSFESKETLGQATLHFQNAADHGSVEGEIYYIFCCIDLKESRSFTWQQILDRLRYYKDCDLIDTSLKENCNSRIPIVIQYIEERS